MLAGLPQQADHVYFGKELYADDLRRTDVRAEAEAVIDHFADAVIVVDIKEPALEVKGAKTAPAQSQIKAVAALVADIGVYYLGIGLYLYVCKIDGAVVSRGIGVELVVATELVRVAQPV